MADLTASVHAAVTLLATTQSVTTAITNPNASRCLSITGTKAGSTLTGNVTITGTDGDGTACSEVIALSGDYAVFGAQVFATVTQIDLPVRVTSGDTVKIGLADRLFDVPTARAFDKGQLASTTDYTNAAILAKEAEIREWLTRVCGVDFFPTTHTNEYHSGDGTHELFLDWARLISVSAAASRSDTTWTAFTADELADIYAVSDAGLVYREGACWTRGHRNLRLTYVAGYDAVPDLVKRAALRVCVSELPTSNVPFAAESYEGGGMDISFAQGDGFGGRWHRDADVRKAIAMYSHAAWGVS